MCAVSRTEEIVATLPQTEGFHYARLADAADGVAVQGPYRFSRGDGIVAKPDAEEAFF